MATIFFYYGLVLIYLNDKIIRYMYQASKYEKYTFCTVFNCLKMVTTLVCKFLLSNSTSRVSYKVKKASISFIVEK